MLRVIQFRFLSAYRLALGRLLLSCALGLAAVPGAGQTAPTIPQRDAASLLRIPQVLKLPESKIDIGNVALIFAKDVYPDLGVPAYSRRIDELATRAKRFIGNEKDPSARIRALSEFLFKVEGYRYDFSKAPEMYYLNGVLDTKKGNCSTLPMLYLVIAQRLGYPVYPVAAPDHLFLRYVVGRNKYLDIETTSATAPLVDDAIYVKGLSVSELALRKGSYLRTMTYREFLGDLLLANAVTFGQRGDDDRAINYLETAVELNPRFPDYYDNLRIAYLRKSKRVSDPELIAEYREKAQINWLMTQRLGFVRPD